MEEELCYATVSFKPFDSQKSAVPEIEESVLYAEVKGRISATQKPPEVSAPECTLKEADLPALCCTSEGTSSVSPAYRRATVILGLLCFLLLAVLTTVSIFSYIYSSKNNNIQAQFTKERDANLQLVADKKELEQDRARLRTLSEELNSTLDTILHKSIFSAQLYCQSSENGLQCSPCPRNWIQNGSRCYFFYTGDDWKTWEASQKYCMIYAAHLTNIDSAEEQEFINLHAQFYYDKYHGYWIGLRKTSNNWVWTNGTTLDGGFWIDNPSVEYCVLSMSSKNPLKSWKSAWCSMLNKWICEVEVFTWPTFLQAQRNLTDPSI